MHDTFSKINKLNVDVTFWPLQYRGTFLDLQFRELLFWITLCKAVKLLSSCSSNKSSAGGVPEADLPPGPFAASS